MYSFNFNEEDKEKKGLYGAPLPSSGSASGEDFYGLGQDDEELTERRPFSYGKDNVFNNTVFASSMPNDIMSKSTQSVPSSIGSAERKSYVSAPTSARDFLRAGYKNDSFMDSMFNHAVPEATPRRGEYLYSVSQDAVKNVASDYMKDGLGSIYDKKLDAARVNSNKAFAEYIQDPIAASRIAQERYNPLAVIDETMKEVDDDKLRKMVEPLARRGGFDADRYIEDYVKPTMRDMMVNDYLEKNKPKSSAEYMLRSAYNNSAIGKLSKIGFGQHPTALLDAESLERYDANKLEKFTAGIGSLLIDAPMFAGIGALSSGVVGKATSMATDRLASRVLSYRAAEGMTKERATEIAGRMIRSNLSNRIAQSAATQGLTLGTYDLANSIAEDVLYNDRVDVGKATGAFAKGLFTGGAVGAVGTRFQRATRGLTGGKRLLASTGVLSAESAVFTFSTEVDKVLNDVDIEPIDIVNDYAESLATLGVMKMSHWRPKGVRNKLKPDGTLKDELKLSNSEKEELREINIDPETFIADVTKELVLPSYGLGATRDAIAGRYLKMMNSKDVSATTKSKLMYIIENKLTSTPPVAFDYGVERRRNGDWVLTTYDFEGNRIERHHFEHAGNAKNYLLVNKATLRNNRITAYERELLQGVESQNLLRQAGIYAKEKSVGVDDISQALYKRAQGVQLSGWEDMLVKDIVERTTYDQSGMVQYLADLRRGIEKKYGLEDGSLLVKINEPFYKNKAAENRALDEYEAMVCDEVNALKLGTDRQRAAEFRRLGETSSFKGMTNKEVREKEVADYYTRHPEENNALGTGFNEKPIDIKDNQQGGYVWSYYGTNNTAEDLNHLRKIALDLSQRLNCEVEFINNERELPYPDVKDKYQVLEYNNKVRAMGWLDRNGKVTINLPNIPSVEEVEKTVVHECVAHYGLLKLFGNHLNSFLEEVYRRASSDVRMAIADMKSRYRFADNYTVIEEYLAHLTEKVVLSTGERAMMTNVKDFLKNSLVRLNLYTGRNRRVTEGDLKSLLRQHAKYIEKRTAPSDYRRWVFGEFDAAKQKENTYYDREAYEQSQREKIAGGKYFINTPAPLYNSKLYQNYEFLPEEKKRQTLRRWGVTDEDVMALKSRDKYRPAGDGFFGNRTLKDVFEDASFYKEYPELANLPVEVVENPQMPLSYDSRGKRLLVDRGFFSTPGNQEQMSRVLQDVVRDYEGFNKAVSMNLFGINSRLGRKYNEAQTVIKALDNARVATPDFDRNGDIDRAFEKEYGFTINEFRKRFPSLDEYTIYKLSNGAVPFNDKVIPSSSAGENVPPISAVSDLADLMKYFNGPLDIVYRKLQQIQSENPQQPKSGVEQLPENDYGFSEFKKQQDDKRRRLKDAVEYQKWRDAFRHLDDELDVLN